jgi:hypothetical protein
VVVVEGIVELVAGARLQKTNPPVGVVAQPKHRFAVGQVACNPMLNPLQELENMIGKRAQRDIDCRSHEYLPQLAPKEKLTNCNTM